MGDKLDDLFAPPKGFLLDELPSEWDEVKKFVVERKHLCKIFMALLKLRVAYAGELSEVTLINKQSLYGYLKVLKKLGIVTRLSLEGNEVPEVLRGVIHRYWARGIRGKAMFERMSWWTVATPDQGGVWSVEQFIELREAIEEKWGMRHSDFVEDLGEVV